MENELNLHANLIEDIEKHCSQLILDLHLYFPEQFDDKEWIRNLFSDVALPADFSVQERDQFVELSCDGRLKNEFKKDMCDFWLKQRAEYGLISDRALKFLFLSARHICVKQVFQLYDCDQKQIRTKLELEPDLHLKLTNSEPDIVNLCLSK